MFVNELFCTILQTNEFMNVRISNDTHKRMIAHLEGKIKITPWVDEAILEKICREKPDSKPCTEPLTDKKKTDEQRNKI